MPLISDLNLKNDGSKRFQKVSYRPWDEELLTPFSKAEDNSIVPLSSSNEDVKNNNKPNSTKVIKSTISNINPTNSLINLEVIQFSTQDLEKESRRLFGAKKIILQYLLQHIEETHNEYVITKAITMDECTLNCKLPPNTTKATLQKLKHRNLLETHENKPGRGGYARYKFSKNVYKFFIGKYNHL